MTSVRRPTVALLDYGMGNLHSVGKALEVAGAQVVTTVLGSPALRQQWEEELAAMRLRIRAMREALVAGLQAAGVQQDMSFITRQVGMFSYSGLAAPQMQRLRAEFGVYGTDSGRICVAALNRRNLDRVVQAIVSVL